MQSLNLHNSDISGLTSENINIPIKTESDHPSVLADIFQDSNNIAIWQRKLPIELRSDLDSLQISDKPLQILLDVTPENCRAELRNGLQNTRNALTDDICSLVDLFCSLFELKRVKLRLTALNRVMCSRFHVDKVPCRLVTTYIGSTTQWLPEQTIDRTKLGKGNNGLSDEYSGIYRKHSDIQHLNNGDVALLKGSLWPGNEPFGLVHRSPSPPPGEIRLLLTLDSVS